MSAQHRHLRAVDADAGLLVERLVRERDAARQAVRSARMVHDRDERAWQRRTVGFSLLAFAVGVAANETIVDLAKWIWP